MSRVKYWIMLQDVHGVQIQREMDDDDLLGVITGRLTEYIMMLDPKDPLSARVSIKRVQELE